MFVDNMILFGYGTVSVGVNVDFRELTLEYTKPPSPVGTKITNEEYKAKSKHGKVVFKYGKDMKELLEDLKQVTAENPIIEFREHVLDFSNFNHKSVIIVREKLIKAMTGNTLILAC